VRAPVPPASSDQRPTVPPPRYELPRMTRAGRRPPALTVAPTLRPNCSPLSTSSAYAAGRRLPREGRHHLRLLPRRVRTHLLVRSDGRTVAVDGWSGRMSQVRSRPGPSSSSHVAGRGRYRGAPAPSATLGLPGSSAIMAAACSQRPQRTAICSAASCLPLEPAVGHVSPAARLPDQSDVAFAAR